MPGLADIIRKPLQRRRQRQARQEVPPPTSATSSSSDSTISELPSPENGRRSSWDMVERLGLGERAGRFRPFNNTRVEEHADEGGIVVEGERHVNLEESATLDDSSNINIHLEFEDIPLSPAPSPSTPSSPSPTFSSQSYTPVATAISPHPAKHRIHLDTPYWNTCTGPSRAAEQKLTRPPSKQDNEILWAVAKSQEGLKDVQDGMRECYALMAPIDQGVVLPVTSPKSETVKGTITRIGTRITKGRLVLNLKTTGRREFDISGDHDVHIPALESLHQHLNTALDALHTLTTSQHLEARDLLESIISLHATVTSSVDLLIGNPSSLRSTSSSRTLPSSSRPHTATHRTNALPQGSPPSKSSKPPPPSWTLSSLPTNAFKPNLGPHLSLHLSIRDACLILTVRVLEPTHEPVHFGTRLGLAFGTVRRLEHDEMEQKFMYRARFEGSAEAEREEVWVREKVGVDAADAHLISILSKLKSLARDLEGLIRNLQAVTGQDTIE